jgi:hypothetical protein
MCGSSHSSSEPGSIVAASLRRISSGGSVSSIPANRASTRRYCAYGRVASYETHCQTSHSRWISPPDGEASPGLRRVHSTWVS